MAWRNIRAWIIAHLALYEAEIVDMPQVFLSFATDSRTLHEKIVEGEVLQQGLGTEDH